MRPCIFKPFLIFMAFALAISIACHAPAQTRTTPAPTPADVPTDAAPRQVQLSPTTPPSPTPEPTLLPTPLPSLTPVPRDPQGLVLITSRFFEDGSSEILLASKDGLTRQVIPVRVFEVFDFNRASSKLAYSTALGHAAQGAQTSVTDLWVYDLTSGTNEQWLPDNVIQARWAPAKPGEPDRLAVSVFSPPQGQQNLVLLRGLGSSEPLTSCISPFFSWAPDGATIAYVAHDMTSGVPERCYGTYLVSPSTRSALRVSEFGTQPTGSASSAEKPVWAPEHNLFFYVNYSLYVIPLDGSPTYVPQIQSDAVTGLLDVVLWSSELQMLIAQTSDMMTPPKIWALSPAQDFHSFTVQHHIADPTEKISYELVDWWVPSYSLLVRQVDYSLGEPTTLYRIWDLQEQTWREIEQ